MAGHGPRRFLACLIALAACWSPALGQGRALPARIGLPATPLASATPAAALPAGPFATLLGPALVPVASPSVPAAAPAGSLAGRLQALYQDSGRAAHAGSVASAQGHAYALRMALQSQLDAMRAEVGDDPDLAAVAADAGPLLDQIEGHLRAGEIDPSFELRLSEKDPRVRVRDRPIRVGVYPVAADPFQWAHLLIGLQAVARLKLDKVVFVLAGDDPRKPSMTPATVRHPMGRAVLKRFAPLFAFSPIADGTLHDGETNIFRLLALNPEQRIDAYYMVGDDHYRLVDKKGNPDTLPKLEANLAMMLVDAARHKVSVAFNERDGRGEDVPTALDVTFLPRMSFEASSTLVRNGKWALMPHAAYDHVRKTRAGLYGIPPDDSSD